MESNKKRKLYIPRRKEKRKRPPFEAFKYSNNNRNDSTILKSLTETHDPRILISGGKIFRHFSPTLNIFSPTLLSLRKKSAQWFPSRTRDMSSFRQLETGRTIGRTREEQRNGRLGERSGGLRHGGKIRGKREIAGEGEGENRENWCREKRAREKREEIETRGKDIRGRREKLETRKTNGELRENETLKKKKKMRIKQNQNRETDKLVSSLRKETTQRKEKRKNTKENDPKEEVTEKTCEWKKLIT